MFLVLQLGRSSRKKLSELIFDHFWVRAIADGFKGVRMKLVRHAVQWLWFWQLTDVLYKLVSKLLLLLRLFQERYVWRIVKSIELFADRFVFKLDLATLRRFFVLNKAIS